MSCHYDPEERTFLYVLYVQSVQLIAESSYPETAVVCRWYVDSADDCSGQFTVASGVEAYPNYFAALCVSHKDKAERSKDLTMTLTADSTHICYACLNLEHYPCEDTVLPAQLPLQTQHGDSVVTLAYANVLFARQPRYWSDIPPALSVEGFFVPPLTGDSQVDALYSHFDQIYKHMASGISETVADAQATASAAAEAEEQGRREALQAAEEAERRRAAEERERGEREAAQRQQREREAEGEAPRRTQEPARRWDRDEPGSPADRAGPTTRESSRRREDDDDRPPRATGSAALANPEPDEKDRRWQRRREQDQREAELERWRREEDERRDAGRQMERRQWEEDRERLREYARRERQRELEERERRATERRRQVQALTQARLASAPGSPSGSAAAAGAELQDAVAAVRGAAATRGGSPARDASAEGRRESRRPSVVAAASGLPRGGREPTEAVTPAASLGQGARRGGARQGGRPGAARGGAASGGSSDASEPCEFYAPPAEAEDGAREGFEQELGSQQAGPRPLARRQPVGRGPSSAARTGAARQAAPQLRHSRLSSGARRAAGPAATRLEERGATALLETAPAEPPAAASDAGWAPRSVASTPPCRRAPQARASAAAQRGPGGGAAAAAVRLGGQSSIVAAALAEAATGELNGLGISPVSKVEECVLRLLVLQRELQGGEPAPDRGQAALAAAAAGLAPRMLHMLEAAKGVCDANRAKLKAFCEESSLDPDRLGLGDKDYLAPQLASLDRLHRQYSSLAQPVPTPARAQEVAAPAGGLRPDGRGVFYAGGPHAACGAPAVDPFAAAAAELRDALGVHAAPHGVHARGSADVRAAPEQPSAPIGIGSRPDGMAPVAAAGGVLQPPGPPPSAAAAGVLGAFGGAGALGAPWAAPSGGGTPPRLGEGPWGESPPPAFPVHVHTGLNTPSGGTLAAHPAAGGEDGRERCLRHSPLDPGACGPQLPILRSGGPGSTPPSVAGGRRRGAAAAAAAASAPAATWAAPWAAPAGGPAPRPRARRSSPSDPPISAASSEAGGPGPTWSSLVDLVGPGPAPRAPQRLYEEGARGDGTGSEGSAPAPRRQPAAPRDGGPDGDSSAPGTPPRGPLRAALQQLRGVADDLVPPAARRRSTTPGSGEAGGRQGGDAAAGSPSRGRAEADERTAAASTSGGAVRPPPEDKYLRILQSLQAKGAGGGLAAQLLQGAGAAAKAPRARPERRRRTESTSASGSSSDEGPHPARRGAPRGRPGA